MGMSYVVDQRPKGKSYSAKDLETMRLEDVRQKLGKLPEAERAHFIALLKQRRIIEDALPGIKSTISKMVGEHNAPDAFALMVRDAEAELQRERALAALQPAKVEPEPPAPPQAQRDAKPPAKRK